MTALYVWSVTYCSYPPTRSVFSDMKVNKNAA